MQRAPDHRLETSDIWHTRLNPLDSRKTTEVNNEDTTMDAVLYARHFVSLL